MTTCEIEHDAYPSPTGAEQSPPTNGSGTVGEHTPSIDTTVFPSVDRARFRRRARWRGSLIASLLFHVGVVAAAYQTATILRERYLYFEQGRNSVALAASVSSPPREAAVEAEVVLPQAEAAAQPFSRREAELPDAPAAQFASVVVDRRVPLPLEEHRRTNVDEPAISHPPEQVPAKQRAETTLAQQVVQQAVESPASTPSAAARGANREAPKLVRPAVIVYPPAALAAGLQGTVRFAVRINRRGEVVSAELIQSSGHAELDAAASEAISRYQFEPIDGPARYADEFQVPIRFQVTKD
jgi:TonB family protein